MSAGSGTNEETVRPQNLLLLQEAADHHRAVYGHRFGGQSKRIEGAGLGIGSERQVLLDARGFKVDFPIVVLAGIMDLWSQYRGTQAQKSLSIATSTAKNLPSILDDYRKVETELAEAEGFPHGYDVGLKVERAMKLGLSTQPWPARMMAAYGQSKAERSPHPGLFPYSVSHFGNKFQHKAWF